jgi:hypothetical protein
MYGDSVRAEFLSTRPYQSFLNIAIEFIHIGRLEIAVAHQAAICLSDVRPKRAMSSFS